MELANLQRLLVRLGTDAVFREEFYADPGKAGARVGLKPADAAACTALAEREIREFARSVRRHRRAEVARELPLTVSLLGQKYADHFKAYARTPPPAGTAPAREDALAFVRFVAPLAGADGTLPPWTADVIRYEADQLQAILPGTQWMIRHYRYPVRDLREQLKHGRPPAVSKRRWTFGFWWHPPSGSVRHWCV